MLHKDYFKTCPECGKKGIYVDRDGHAHCKYCGLVTKWSEIKG